MPSCQAENKTQLTGECRACTVKSSQTRAHSHIITDSSCQAVIGCTIQYYAILGMNTHSTSCCRNKILFLFSIGSSSLIITLIVLIPALLGGLLAGYLAKQKKIWADLGEDVVMFPVEVLTSTPGLILLAFILIVTKPNLQNLLIWLTLAFLLPRSVRMVQNWWVAASPEKAIWIFLFCTLPIFNP